MIVRGESTIMDYHAPFDQGLIDDLKGQFVGDIARASSDWLILGHYFPVMRMPAGRLCACKTKTKSHITNNLYVRSLRENLKLRSCRIDLAIAIQYGKVLV